MRLLTHVGTKRNPYKQKGRSIVLKNLQEQEALLHVECFPMEMFSAVLALCEGKPPNNNGFPYQSRFFEFKKAYINPTSELLDIYCNLLDKIGSVIMRLHCICFVSNTDNKPYQKATNAVVMLWPYTICLMSKNKGSASNKKNGSPRSCLVVGHHMLTHWARDKMAAISQKTFSRAFSWIKMHEIRLRFHWSLFPKVKLTIFQHWFR